MDKSEFLSRRTLLGASSIGVTGLAAAALLHSVPAHAASTPSFIYKSLIDYGVVPGSASDQTTLIQSALNDLVSGDCLVFPPGTYRVSTGLAIASRDNIHIEAPGATLLVVGTGTNNDVLSLSSVTNSSIRGLKITSNSTTSGAGIVLGNSQRVALHDLNIWNMGTYCLDAGTSWWLSTHNCAFLAAGLASVRHGSDMNAVTHIGARFAPYAYATSGGNPVNAGAVGILYDYGSAATLISCDFSNAAIGADIQNAKNVTLQGCYFESVGTGVRLGNGTKVAANTTIDTCYMSLPTTSVVTNVIGIDVQRAEIAQIRNNFIVTQQFSSTETVYYNNTVTPNNNIFVDANGYVNGSTGSTASFNCAIVHAASTGDKVKSYMTQTIGNC